MMNFFIFITNNNYNTSSLSSPPLSHFSTNNIFIKILLLAMMKNNRYDDDFQNIIRGATSRQYLRLYSFAPRLKSLFSTPGIESTFPMTTQR